MKDSTRASFWSPTIDAICGNYFTKQKTQDLVSFRLWRIDHGMVSLIWSNLAFQKNLFMWIDV